MNEEELNTNETIPQMVEDVRNGKMSRRHMIATLTALGLSSAGIGAIAAVASRALAAKPAAQHKPQQHTTQQGVTHPIQQHDQHLAYQTQGNIPALQQDYAADAMVEDSMYAEPFVGHAAIMGRKGVGMSAIPDLRIQLTNRILQGDQLTVEWVASGTHSGDFPSLPATGRAFSIPGVTVVVRREGKIVRESLYYDMGEVQRQLM